MINERTASLLNVQEVQISLDGMQDSHDHVRGKGSFSKAVKAIGILRKKGKDVSVATMLFPANLKDIPKMETLLKNIGITEWSIDLPCFTGNLKKKPFEFLSYKKAAPYLKYAFGGDNHGGAAGLSCGSHLCSVDTSGKVSKCSFYRNTPVGSIDEGFETCWKKLRHHSLKDLDCDCSYLQECGGDADIGQSSFIIIH